MVFSFVLVTIISSASWLRIVNIRYFSKSGLLDLSTEIVGIITVIFTREIFLIGSCFTGLYS